jgi:hypothetical protein
MSVRCAAAGAILLLAVAAACSSDGGDDGLDAGQTEVIGPAEEGIDGVVAVRVGDASHTESVVDYDLRPPAGGAHNPVWWNCGFYDEVVPDEHAVHDLEHGVVWVAYDPDRPADEVEALHDLARANDRLLVSPYPSAAGDAVVATAWARQLRLDTATDDRLVAFIDRYVDGSQAPEAGASCSGSPLGSPLP